MLDGNPPGEGRAMRTEVEFSEMPEAECRALLAERSFGRLAVVRRGRPLVFPVNYVFDGEVVVFRTDPGLKLSGAPLRNVAFQIDEVDETSGTGWSVLVQGFGYEITNAVDLRSEARRALPVTPMAPGDKAHWVEIIPDAITGRRISATATA